MSKLVIRIWAGIYLSLFASNIFTLALVVHYFEFFSRDPTWYPLQRTAWVVREILDNTPTERIEAERLYLADFLERAISIYPSADPSLPMTARGLGPDAAPTFLTASSGKSSFYAPLHKGALIVSVDPATHLYRPLITPLDYSVVLLFLLAITIPIGLFLSRSTNRRIRNLERAARQISNGDTTTRIYPVFGGPLGSIEDCFNQMADRIHWMVQTQQQMLVEFVSRFQTGLRVVRDILETRPDADFRTRLERLHDIVDDLEHFVGRLLRSERRAHTTAMKPGTIPSDEVRHRLSAFALLTGFRSYDPSSTVPSANSCHNG